MSLSLCFRCLQMKLKVNQTTFQVLFGCVSFQPQRAVHVRYLPTTGQKSTAVNLNADETRTALEQTNAVTQDAAGSAYHFYQVSRWLCFWTFTFQFGHVSLHVCMYVSVMYVCMYGDTIDCLLSIPQKFWIVVCISAWSIDLKLCGSLLIKI